MSTTVLAPSDRTASAPIVTRFAPSPTGDLHLGNARTALYNLLLAKRHGGRFVLRVEDTDAERSRAEFRERQLEDLRWLGLDWDAGPDREDALGPYRQALREPLYARDFELLERSGTVYPCFCSPYELELSRKTQLSKGQAPRYAGTCRELSTAEQAKRRALGIVPTLRFRVPPGEDIPFVDEVRGPQSVSTNDIGDFIVRRADGSPAFLLSNAVDDAAMGVTHVLRGEDHLSNTPRQLLILAALGLAAPAYGHLSLLLDAAGAPLSKRTGAQSVRARREQGYLPAALLNHLFRLGVSGAERRLFDIGEMAREFEPGRLSRAPAHFDESQLRAWQREAVRCLKSDEARGWLDDVLSSRVEPRHTSAFLDAVLPNVELPSDARRWADVAFGGAPHLDIEASELVRDAGPDYFRAALRGFEQSGGDLGAITRAIQAATGRKGSALYQPLRAALTGRAEGPQLGPLLKVMLGEQIRERLARFAPSAP